MEVVELCSEENYLRYSAFRDAFDAIGIVGLLLLIYWAELRLGDAIFIGEVLPKFW